MSQNINACNFKQVWGDQTWPDNWTSVTQDGKLSAQFEQTMVVTDTGVEVCLSIKQIWKSAFSHSLAFNTSTYAISGSDSTTWETTRPLLHGLLIRAVIAVVRRQLALS